jgi:ABC-type multidrug transport system ATPase subunit
MIEFKDVTKRYRRRGPQVDALHAVSLAIPEGAVYAVVGPNGAGKSTLLSLLLGFIRPSSGAVTIAGDAPREYLRDFGAGYLPERFSIPADWLIGDALRMFAELDTAANFERAVELLGLADHLGKTARELSRGLLQRVGLAQALLARHALIVLDEPTEGLDPVWRIRLRDIVTELRNEGCTIVMASHDMTEVERNADRAVVLDGGAIRDVLETRAAPASRTYRVRLASPSPRVHEAFPHAAAIDELTFTTAASSAEELSARLSALLELGAVIVAVEPLQLPLEDRVRDALGNA